MGDDNGDIEPSNRSRKPRSRDRRDPVERADATPTTGDSRSSADRRPAGSADTLAAAVAQTATDPTTVETDSVSATLVGVPRIDPREFVYAHQLDPTREEHPRPVALFDLENRTDRLLRWRSACTKFIGTDEYTYQPARLSLEPEQLGPGCHTRQVELEPGSKARMITLVEALPRGVEVAKVVQTIPRRGAAQNERLAFAVE